MKNKKLHDFPKRKNATLHIGNKWKGYKKETRLYYEQKGKENLEKYFDLLAVSSADKSLFLLRKKKLHIPRERIMLLTSLNPGEPRV